MEVREMPQVKDIAEYLRTMTFRKKLFGGCDTESVFDHIEVVTGKYEAILSSLLTQNEQTICKLNDLQTKLAQQSDTVPPEHAAAYADLQRFCWQQKEQIANLQAGTLDKEQQYIEAFANLAEKEQELIQRYESIINSLKAQQNEQLLQMTAMQNQLAAMKEKEVSNRVWYQDIRSDLNHRDESLQAAGQPQPPPAAYPVYAPSSVDTQPPPVPQAETIPWEKNINRRADEARRDSPSSPPTGYKIRTLEEILAEANAVLASTDRMR